eukprot:2104697-Amphidinium_carterae.1
MRITLSVGSVLKATNASSHRHINGTGATSSRGTVRLQLFALDHDVVVDDGDDGDDDDVDDGDD